MSDFVFTSQPRPRGELARHLQSMFVDPAPAVVEFHGAWGSLAASHNLYRGFQPLETDQRLFVVVGGPVLCFSGPGVRSGSDPVAGTRLLAERHQAGSMRWADDLSGPFVVLVVDKASGRLECVTDLMMFIPVFRHVSDQQVVLGTQVNLVAGASGQAGCFDPVSVADFIFHDVVTPPHTAYKEVWQGHPATVHRVERKRDGVEFHEEAPYWLPREECPFASLREASEALRQGLVEYVDRVACGVERVALFLSAGEDSRAVAGLLSKLEKKDAFIFLDHMNREGLIARRVARRYGAEWHAEFRQPAHYLELLPAASALLGRGAQYLHAHSLGLHKKCGLEKYDLVFGGYLADSLIKARYAPTRSMSQRFPFLPQRFVPGETCRQAVVPDLGFSEEIRRAIQQRRSAWMDKLEAIRPASAHEWFGLWPATMRESLPMFQCNRRLFPVVEPFLCHASVKISAAVPVAWKLNRRLFHKAVQPFLRPSRWIRHADGRLPYFPWWVNLPLQASTWLWRESVRWMGFSREHQGPWSDWPSVMNGPVWKTMREQCLANRESVPDYLQLPLRELLEKEKGTYVQRLNLIQVLHEQSAHRG